MSNEEILEAIDAIQGELAMADYLRKALDSEERRSYFEGYYDGVGAIIETLYNATIGSKDGEVD